MDAIVPMGVLIKGDTDHYDMIKDAATSGLCLALSVCLSVCLSVSLSLCLSLSLSPLSLVSPFLAFLATSGLCRIHVCVLVCVYERERERERRVREERDREREG